MPAPHAITKTLALPDGRQISIETGKLAKFADGAVVVRLGDTMLLATVVSAPSQRDGVDSYPSRLTIKKNLARPVRFRVRFSAAKAACRTTKS
jgi:hypothetical protein